MQEQQQQRKDTSCSASSPSKTTTNNDHNNSTILASNGRWSRSIVHTIAARQQQQQIQQQIQLHQILQRHNHLKKRNEGDDNGPVTTPIATSSPAPPTARKSATNFPPPPPSARKRQRSPPPQTIDPELADTSSMTPEQLNKHQVKLDLHRKLKERVEIKAAMVLQQQMQQLQKSFVPTLPKQLHSGDPTAAAVRQPLSRGYSKKKPRPSNDKSNASSNCQLTPAYQSLAQQSMFNYENYETEAIVLNAENMTFPPVWDEQASAVYYDALGTPAGPVQGQLNPLTQAAAVYGGSQPPVQQNQFYELRNGLLDEEKLAVSGPATTTTPQFHFDFASTLTDDAQISSANTTDSDPYSEIFWKESLSMFGALPMTSSQAKLSPIETYLARGLSIAALSTSNPWTTTSSVSDPQESLIKSSGPTLPSLAPPSQDATPSLGGTCKSENASDGFHTNRCQSSSMEYCPCILSADSGVSLSPLWSGQFDKMTPSPVHSLLELDPSHRIHRRGSVMLLGSSTGSSSSIMDFIQNSPTMKLFGQCEASDFDRLVTGSRQMENTLSPPSFTPMWDVTGALGAGECLVLPRKLDEKAQKKTDAQTNSNQRTENPESSAAVDTSSLWLQYI